MTRADEAYIEALRRIGKLADAWLDRPDADPLLMFIGAELERIGYVIPERHHSREAVH